MSTQQGKKQLYCPRLQTTAAKLLHRSNENQLRSISIKSDYIKWVRSTKGVNKLTHWKGDSSVKNLNRRLRLETKTRLIRDKNYARLLSERKF